MRRGRRGVAADRNVVLANIEFIATQTEAAAVTRRSTAMVGSAVFAIEVSSEARPAPITTDSVAMISRG